MSLFCLFILSAHLKFLQYIRCYKVSVTFICPLAVSPVSGYSPSVSAELAASKICEKYANLPYSYIFQPMVFANLGTPNSSDVALISALWHQISTKSDDLRPRIHLSLPATAITLQRLNSILLRESFVCHLDK